MTERELAELLRRIDEHAPLDDRDLAFKARLRDDLDTTLDHGGVNRARVGGVAVSRTARPWSRLAGAAVLVGIVVAAVAILAGRSSDSPPSPAALPPTTATSVPAPVLEPAQACVRFRSSSAAGLLTDSSSGGATAAEIDDSVADLDALIADVLAASDDELERDLRTVRNTLNEAGLLLVAGDRAGSDASLQASRIEFAGIAPDGAFGSCFAG